MSTRRITGLAAISAAEADPSVTLCSHTDPTEEGREGLTLDEARAIAREDAGLVYADVPTTTRGARAQVTPDTTRQIDVLRFTPTEKAIWDAQAAVEALPADTRLTEAGILLAQARLLVADYVDAQLAEAAS